MKIEDQVLCWLTRQRFTSHYYDKLLQMASSHDIDWENVFETAAEQHVTPLVYTNLASLTTDRLAVPETILNKFKKAYIHNVFVKRGTAEILQKVLALFEQKGIDVMLVKGAALNELVYDQPWYTVSYDVDLVIRAWPNQIDPTDHAEIVEKLESFNHQRNEFKEHIEYDYYEHHDVTMNNVLSVDFEQLWVDAHKITVGNYEVFVLSPEDMLIAAAINSCRKRFFRLKSLCDIATIIEKYPHLDWTALARKAETYQCQAILYVALVVTQTTIGCDLPPNFLQALKLNPVRVFLIQKLVQFLSRTQSLANLATRSNNTLFGREFSWPLMLTYATYQRHQLMPKLTEIYKAWRNPPPPVPI